MVLEKLSLTTSKDLRITNALRFPQKNSRTARLGRFALLLVSSPHYARFIIHRMRSQLRPLRNIVALLAWNTSHCSLFLHLIMLASSSTGRARNFVQLSRSGKPQSKNKRQRLSLPLELLVGLEPTTCALRMRCSTN